MVVGYSSDIGPHPERLDLVYTKLFRSPADLAAHLGESGEKEVRKLRWLYGQARATFRELPAVLRCCSPDYLSYELAWTRPWKGYNVGKFKLVTPSDNPVVTGTLQINPPSDHAHAGLEVVVHREGVRELAAYEGWLKVRGRKALPESQVLARIERSIRDVLVYGQCVNYLTGDGEHYLRAA